MIKYFLLLFAITCNAQSIYYQKDYATYIDNNLLEITIDNNKFSIHNGKFSENGNFVAGYIIDGELKSYINIQLEAKGIIDFFSFKNIKFILYSLEDNKLLLQRTTKCFYGISFIHNYLVLDSWTSKIEIINISDLSKTTIIKQRNESFRFFDNYLYLIKDNENEIQISKFNFRTKRFEIYTKINKSLFTPKKRYLSIKQIIDNRVLLKYEDNSTLWLLNTDNQNIVRKFETTNSFVRNKNLFINSEVNSYGNWYFYTINLIDTATDTVFAFNEFREKFEIDVNAITTATKCENKVYFIISSVFKEDRNLLVYNLSTKELKKITVDGNVSNPIGNFKQ